MLARLDRDEEERSCRLPQDPGGHAMGPEGLGSRLALGAEDDDVGVHPCRGLHDDRGRITAKDRGGYGEPPGLAAAGLMGQVGFAFLRGRTKLLG
jgi:hypothetical protein